uniref:Uncharacterized protein n=1 Tax=viral metagenome TaxID=1070528 RepID=A0A6C0EBU5_9ZZZZ
MCIDTYLKIKNDKALKSIDKILKLLVYNYYF